MRFRTAFFLIATGLPAVVAAADQPLLRSDSPAARAGSQAVDAIAMGDRSAKVVCEALIHTISKGSVLMKRHSTGRSPQHS